MLISSSFGCGDAGRGMFFDEVGQYFAQPPKAKPLPVGTPCSVCGVTTATLWPNSTGTMAVCQAQLTITRKRAGRTAADQPCQPAANAAGMVSFAEGSMVIAGPQVRRLVTRVLPDRALPPQVEVGFPVPGSIVKALRGLVEAPPPPPFVVLVFAKKADFRSQVTHDPSLIHVGGPDGFSIARARLREMLALVDGLSDRELVEALDLRERQVTGRRRDDDDEKLRQLEASYPALAGTWHRLPSPGSTEAMTLKRMRAT